MFTLEYNLQTYQVANLGLFDGETVKRLSKRRSRAKSSKLAC